MWGVAANDVPIDPVPAASAAIIPSLVSTTISERDRGSISWPPIMKRQRNICPVLW